MDVLRFLYFFLAILCIVLFFYVIYDRTNKRFWISLNAKRPKMQVAYGSAITILLFFLSFGVYARLIGHNMPICKNKTADVIAQSINPDCHSSALSTSLPDADIFIAINEWLDRLAFKVCDPHGAPYIILSVLFFGFILVDLVCGKQVNRSQIPFVRLWSKCLNGALFISLFSLISVFLVVCSSQYNYFEIPITQSRAVAFANSMSARVDSVPANAIDFGLPSGTLWADHNIGAKFPTDCGWYLAWGETAPHPDAVYRTKNYKHYYKSISVGHGKSRKTYTIFSKYQQQYKDIELYKNPDRIPRLDLMDDVARTQWHS